MKMLLGSALLCASGIVCANTYYYNEYGTYEGFSSRQGSRVYYYNYNGDYVGTQIDTTPPKQTTGYKPATRFAPIPIPGTYDGITPPSDIDAIGDFE